MHVVPTLARTTRFGSTNLPALHALPPLRSPIMTANLAQQPENPQADIFAGESPSWNPLFEIEWEDIPDSVRDAMTSAIASGRAPANIDEALRNLWEQVTGSAWPATADRCNDVAAFVRHALRENG